ncbi:MAG: hypothetical protein ACRDXC_14625 [Acidimicrobiales bacterium]
MSPADRCEEIKRLIDDALGEVLPSGRVDDEHERDDLVALARDLGMPPLHATDGRWRQRPITGARRASPHVA